MNERLSKLVDGRIADVRTEELPVDVGSAATGRLTRINGTTTDGREFAFFVKRVQSVRHWPHLHMVPEEYRDEFISGMPWRAEVDAYRSDVKLPDGLRRPRLHLIDELGDDRVDLWLEDVQSDGSAWDLAAYERTAYLLAGLAAMNPAATDGADPIYRYVKQRIMISVLPELADPAVWRHPAIAEAADGRLRSDLLGLADRIPELLAAMAALPHTMVHGDATPHNLVPATDGDLVALDWGWHSPHPLGGDLAQLLAGRAHDGEIPVEVIPLIHETISQAYLRGLADHGHPGEGALRGFHLALLLRSGFTMIPADRLDLPHEAIRRRVGMARFITDLALDL
jgi:hypothetical protein